jgi:hypothetical protein
MKEMKALNFSSQKGMWLSVGANRAGGNSSRGLNGPNRSCIRSNGKFHAPGAKRQAVQARSMMQTKDSQAFWHSGQILIDICGFNQIYKQMQIWEPPERPVGCQK